MNQKRSQGPHYSHCVLAGKLVADSVDESVSTTSQSWASASVMRIIHSLSHSFLHSSVGIIYQHEILQHLCVRAWALQTSLDRHSNVILISWSSRTRGWLAHVPVMSVISWRVLSSPSECELKKLRPTPCFPLPPWPQHRQRSTFEEADESESPPNPSMSEAVCEI